MFINISRHTINQLLDEDVRIKSVRSKFSCPGMANCCVFHTGDITHRCKLCFAFAWPRRYVVISLVWHLWRKPYFFILERYIPNSNIANYKSFTSMMSKEGRFLNILTGTGLVSKENDTLCKRINKKKP